EYDDVAGVGAFPRGLVEPAVDGQQRDHHADHAADADDGDQRGPEPLRQAREVHGRHGEGLLEHGFPQRPARASTICSRMARQAGGSPVSRASTTAAINPSAMAGPACMVKPTTVLMVGNSKTASPRPSAPENRQNTSVSVMISQSTPRPVKPSVFSTPSSEVRSRTDCIITAPTESRRAKNTAPMIS